MELLLFQDIENAFHLITRVTQGFQSILKQAILKKWNKLGLLIFCSSNITSSQVEQVSLAQFKIITCQAMLSVVCTFTISEIHKLTLIFIKLFKRANTKLSEQTLFL